MTVERIHSSYAACVLDCGGCDAAFGEHVFWGSATVPVSVFGVPAKQYLLCVFRAFSRPFA